jgi:hypothetical protein
MVEIRNVGSLGPELVGDTDLLKSACPFLCQGKVRGERKNDRNQKRPKHETHAFPFAFDGQDIWN